MAVGASPLFILRFFHERTVRSDRRRGVGDATALPLPSRFRRRPLRWVNSSVHSESDVMSLTRLDCPTRR